MNQDEMKRLAIKHGGTELPSYTSTSVGNTTAILFAARELEAYTKAVEEKTGVVDCRTCAAFSAKRHGCMNVIKFENGERYKGLGILQMYKKVPE